jgi:hypothetical protein
LGVVVGGWTMITVIPIMPLLDIAAVGLARK